MRKLHAPCVEDRGSSWRVRVRYIGTDRKRHTIVYKFGYDKSAKPEQPGSREEVFQHAVAVASAERHSLRVKEQPLDALPEENSLADWITRYLQDDDAHVGRKGWQQERVRLEWLLATHPDFCRRRITNLKPNDFAGKPDSLASIMKNAKGKRLAISTVRRILATISLVYNRAIDGWEIKVDNPVRSPSLPTVHDERERTASKDEWQAIIHALSETDPATRCAIQCLRWTGARRSEITKLEWQDIDGFDSAEPVATFRDTKSHDGKPRSRSVMLPREAKQALKAFLGRNKAPTHGKVFTTKHGKPLTADALTKAWVRACKRAGVDDLRLHDLRHTRITEVASVLSMLEASAVSGHRDIRMLKRYYNPDPREIGRKLARSR